MDCIRKVMFSDIYCNIILNFINFINLLIVYSFSFIHWLIQKLNHQSLFHKKTLILLIVKIICTLFLFNNALDVTKNYLNYPYIYKLVVSDNRDGFDLPRLNLCTEKNVKFDISKIINYFDILQEIDNHWEQVSEVYEEIKDHYQDYFDNFRMDNYEKYLNHMEPFVSGLNFNKINIDILESVRNYNFSRIFKKYLEFIGSELNLQESNNLVITEKQLFKCSANIHLRNEKFNSSSFYFKNCFDRTRIKQSIGESNFGICYTFFAKNYSIYLKHNDSINITIDDEVMGKFLKTGYQNATVEYKLKTYQIELDRPISRFSDQYFGWFLFTSDRHSSGNYLSALEIKYIPFDGQLKFTMSTVHLLSIPYMDECKNTCK